MSNPFAAFLPKIANAVLSDGSVVTLAPLTLGQLPRYYAAVEALSDDIKVDADDGDQEAAQRYRRGLLDIVRAAGVFAANDTSINDLERIVDAIVDVNITELERGVVVETEDEDAAEWNWLHSALYLVRHGHDMERLMSYSLGKINALLEAHDRLDRIDHLHQITVTRMAHASGDTFLNYVRRLNGRLRANARNAPPADGLQ